MFGLRKQKHDSDTDGFFQRLRRGLKKTRIGLFDGLGDIFSGEKTLDPVQMEEIESRLLMADLGMESTMQIMSVLSQEARRNKLNSFDELVSCLREQMIELLTPIQAPLEIAADASKPFVILVVGVNGVGNAPTGRCRLDDLAVGQQSRQ